ncbi:MAG: glycosyltransferase [bacterium]|nr:glycosyltransferase [bacterium]
MKPIISVVIVNYRVKHFVEQCIFSLESTSRLIPLEIIVVDNYSNDGSIEYLKERFPNIRLIELNENIGFAKANNIAFQFVQGEYVLILNPDTVVSENALPTLINFLKENPNCGIVTPKLIKRDGSIDVACRRSIPTPWIAFTRISGLSLLFPKSKLFGKYNLTYLDENTVSKVGAVSGAFMLLPKSVLEKVGGFDERFFMYGEDLDLCKCVSDIGYDIFYLPEVTSVHYRGESTRRSNIKKEDAFYDAMFLFAEKHYKSWWKGYGILLIRFGVVIAKLFKKIRNLSFLFPLAIDVSIVLFSFFIGYTVKFGSLSIFSIDLRVTVANTILVLLSLFAIGTYTSVGKVQIISALKAGILAAFISATYTFFFLQDYMFSRLIVLVATTTWTILLPLWRLIYQWVLHSKWLRHFTRSVVLIIGTDSLATIVAEKLKELNSDYELAGFVKYKSQSLPLSFKYDPLGDTDELERIIQSERVTDVFFSTGEVSYAEIMKIAHRLAPMNVQFKILSSESPGSAVALLDIEWNTSANWKTTIKKVFRRWGI